jgi:hypothetical protein
LLITLAPRLELIEQSLNQQNHSLNLIFNVQKMTPSPEIILVTLLTIDKCKKKISI